MRIKTFGSEVFVEYFLFLAGRRGATGGWVITRGTGSEKEFFSGAWTKNIWEAWTFRSSIQAQRHAND